jgi:prolyl 4-hydroxylase
VITLAAKRIAKVRTIIHCSLDSGLLLAECKCCDTGLLIQITDPFRIALTNLLDEKVWADAGECRKNPRYMLVYCAKACNICHYKGDLEEVMRQRLEEKLRQEELERALQKTAYGLEQTITDDASQEAYDKMIEYMEKTVMVDPKYESVRQECKLRSENCVFWASIGECEKTRAYMVVQCAPACQTCEQLDLKERCPYDPDEPTALQPGDLNKLFEKIVQLEEYSPTVLSQPGVASEFVDHGPWVVTLDNFLTDAECDRLIELGGTQGYIESADVGEKLWDGTSMVCLYMLDNLHSQCACM